MNRKCIQTWKIYVKRDLEGTENKLIADGHQLLKDPDTLTQQKHITAWKQLIEKAKAELHNLWFNKVHQPRIAYYNCEKHMVKLREIKGKMLAKWKLEYVKKFLEMLKAEQPEVELSRTRSESMDSVDSEGFTTAEFICPLLDWDGTFVAHRRYSNLYESEDQNSFISDSDSFAPSVSMIGTSLFILLVLCCIYFGALIVGGIGGYLLHAHVKKDSDIEAQIH